MLIPMGIVVRSCSGSFVVPVGTGSFLCVSALKVSASIACFLKLCLLHLVFSRASRTPPLHEWLCQRALNEGWVYAQEKIKSAAGVDARWQRLFDDHGDEFTGCCMRDCNAW
jgi:hypothetical protein